MFSRKQVGLIGLVLLLAPAAARAQGEEVTKKVTAQRQEKVLDGLKITYKKAALPSSDGSFLYDYERNNFKLRLYNFGGQDLMLEALFPRTDWETVNKWNGTTKFSRASLRKDKLGEFTALESNLDCVGGVTEGAIKQFLNQFNEEVRNFQLATVGPPQDEVTYKTVSDAHLEKLLKDMSIPYKKSANQNATATFFDFERNQYKFRLTCYEGKDLMIESAFKKAGLDAINQWNLKRNFVRAALYDGNPEYTSLEANLDCTGGVSDNIIRYFIRTFEEEAKQFDQYLNGKNK